MEKEEPLINLCKYEYIAKPNKKNSQIITADKLINKITCFNYLKLYETKNYYYAEFRHTIFSEVEFYLIPKN